MHEKPYHFSDNLSKGEKMALKELTEDQDIVIKPADKGEAICIQDAVKYKQEILRQLSDETYYKKLSSDPTLSFKEEVHALLKDGNERGWISKSEFDFLYCQHPVRPVFYTLPKLHKSLTDPPGRPIVAQINSLLTPLSEFVDFFIKPAVQMLPAYLKDSTDFLNKVSSITDLPNNVYLLTLDVSSVY